MVVVQNGHGLLGTGTLEPGVSQEGINGVNWFLICWNKFWKAKSYFNDFWVVVVKNGHSLLGPGTLKPVACQNRLIKWVDFLHADTNLGKLKFTLLIFGWEW